MVGWASFGGLELFSCSRVNHRETPTLRKFFEAGTSGCQYGREGLEPNKGWRERKRSSKAFSGYKVDEVWKYSHVFFGNPSSQLKKKRCKQTDFHHLSINTQRILAESAAPRRYLVPKFTRSTPENYRLEPKNLDVSPFPKGIFLGEPCSFSEGCNWDDLHFHIMAYTRM